MSKVGKQNNHFIIRGSYENLLPMVATTIVPHRDFRDC
jgi:hypothetical protein